MSERESERESERDETGRTSEDNTNMNRDEGVAALKTNLPSLRASMTFGKYSTD